MGLKRDLTISFSIIAGTFLFTGAVLYLLIRELSFQAAKTEDVKRTIYMNSSAIDFTSYYKQAKPEADKYRNSIKLLLPAKDDLLQFPQWLISLARSKRLDAAVSFDGDPVVPSGGPGYINFSLSAEGSLPAISDFIGLVSDSNNQYLTQLSSADLSKTSGGSFHLSSKGRVFFEQ